MATANYNTRWSNAQCQRVAGMRCDEFLTRVSTIQDVENRSEVIGKYQPYISSNGYYGYLPILSDAEDCAMDTNDAGAENSMGNGTHPKNDSCVQISTVTNMQNGNVLSVGITLGRRKRVSAEDNCTQETKRQRKEEQESVSEKDSESSLHFIIEGGFGFGGDFAERNTWL